MTDLDLIAAWISENPTAYAELRARVLTDAGRDPAEKLPAKGSMTRQYLDALMREEIRKVNKWPSGRAGAPIESVPVPAKASVAVPSLKAGPVVERRDAKALQSGERE